MTATQAAETATMSVKDIKNALSKTHYIVAAYDSQETFNQHIVVVLPEVSEPTWVLRPGARKPTRRNVLALAVPSIDALTLDLSQSLTRMVTDYITVREFPEFAREGGFIEAGRPVSMPWNR